MLTFSQLSDVQTVGIGLYLALAVIQAVSGTGLAGLTRRVTSLRTAVVGAKLGPVELANLRRLAAQISGLEIGFHTLNRRFLKSVLLLFVVSVAYFAYCTLEQDRSAGLDGLAFILFFYLALPVLIFLAYSALMHVRCRSTAERVKIAEDRVKGLLLARPSVK